MIYTEHDHGINIEDKAFLVGHKVIATGGDYKGLTGTIWEIRTEKDTVTEDDDPDILVEFCVPIYSNQRHGCPNIVEDWGLDMIFVPVSLLLPI